LANHWPPPAIARRIARIIVGKTSAATGTIAAAPFTRGVARIIVGQAHPAAAPIAQRIARVIVGDIRAVLHRRCFHGLGDGHRGARSGAEGHHQKAAAEAPPSGAAFGGRLVFRFIFPGHPGRSPFMVLARRTGGISLTPGIVRRAIVISS
jgi:hypothetical protein